MNINNALYRRLSTYFVVGVVIMLTSCNSSSQETSATFYGQDFSLTEVKKLSDVEAALTLNDSLPEVTLSGEVKAVCQKKGCWMTLNSSNGNRVRVTFKDYGFFVPKDLSGSVVTIKGVVKSEELSTEMDQHYAEDEGRAFDPEADLREISIVASGVTVTSKMN